MRPARRSRSFWVLAVVAILAMCAFAGTALAPGGPGKHPFAVTELAQKSAPNPLAGRLEKVYGTSTPASRYGAEVADMEDYGTNAAGEDISELSPLPARAFTTPEREYRAYAERWIARALAGAASLRRALESADRPAAIAAWERTWSDYLHLGAVYLTGEVATLNRAIDGTPGDLPEGSYDPHYTGLHRIEMGLWSGASPRSLIGRDSDLEGELERMRGAVARVRMTPLEYATRAHEIVEDAQRDLLSGTDVPWSRQGVLGTAAGLSATEEVFHTLEPLLSGREDTEGEVRAELQMLGGVLAAIRRRHGGHYPSLAELGSYEHEQLNGYTTGALTALEQMPGTLETEAHRAIPRLPAPSRAERAEERAAERVAEGAP